MALTKEQKELKKRQEELFGFILEKTGMTYTEFQLEAKHNYVVCNLDMLTKEERKRFKVNLKTKNIPAGTKEEKQRLNEIFRFIFKKSGGSYADYWDSMKNCYIVSNKEILNTFTEEECKRFHLCKHYYIRTYDTLDMSKFTIEERVEVRKQTKELLELLLKRTGTKKKDFIEPVYRDFMYHNSDLLTETEREKYNKLVECVCFFEL